VEVKDKDRLRIERKICSRCGRIIEERFIEKS